MITSVIVNYKTPELTIRAVESIRKYVNEVIVVNNSDCKFPFVTFPTHKNIGHGPGLNYGIEKSNNDYILLMDSDAELINPEIINILLDELHSPNYIYGAGKVIKVNNEGVNDKNGKIDYLHPFFALIRKDMYFKYPPFINHGAPLIRTMKAGVKVLNVDLKSMVNHAGKSTRNLKPVEYNHKNWDTP